jgi:hypothetical protein
MEAQQKEMQEQMKKMRGMQQPQGNNPAPPKK